MISRYTVNLETILMNAVIFHLYQYLISSKKYLKISNTFLFKEYLLNQNGLTGVKLALKFILLFNNLYHYQTHQIICIYNLSSI